MLIKTKRDSEVPASEITPEGVYRERRRFLQDSTELGLALALGGSTPALGAAPAASAQADFPALRPGPYRSDEPPTAYDDIAGYTNFYEFGTGKSTATRLARDFQPRPWRVRIEGEAEITGDFDLEDILRPHPLEERIYRLRCVETWSMVVPWVGFPLGDLIKRFKPASKAKFVEFFTLHDPRRMPGQNSPFIDWPYREGLRMDEAMHPLTILAVGLYGKPLPNQNGAPLRLVVPWKYGFKSIKSIVKIAFRETLPATTWNELAPEEYGFYANVNPEVGHPRWSQAKERRIGEFFRRETLPFNGYAEEVAGLYAGMDLRQFY